MTTLAAAQAPAPSTGWGPDSSPSGSALPPAVAPAPAAAATAAPSLQFGAAGEASTVAAPPTAKPERGKKSTARKPAPANSESPAAERAAEAADASDPDERALRREEEERRLQLTMTNSLLGSSGLMHVQSATTGTPGTFRVSLLSSYYSTTGLLCQSKGDCLRPSGVTTTEDDVTGVGADLGLSVTLARFLEAHAGMHSYATSNSMGSPRLLQVLGDTNLGAKLITPYARENVLSFGALADLWLLNGTGSLGVSDASFRFKGLATADFSHPTDIRRRVPLRVHFNAGYMLDNSGNLVVDTESARGGRRVSRIERFSLGVNRVDRIELGLGAEYVHPIFRPFAEYTIDVPSNTRGYTCTESMRATGDQCLGNVSGMSHIPSRMTLGARVTPGLPGLTATAAIDIGVSGGSIFVEEISPEVPWRLYFGLAFATDTKSQAPKTIIKRSVVKEYVVPPPVTEYRLAGTVTDERTQQPIPSALLRFEGRPLSGMIANDVGAFETAALSPGEYSFAVQAEGYRPARCSATIVAAPATAASTDGAGAATLSGSPATAPPASTTPATEAQRPGAPASVKPLITRVACSLKALPAVGTISGNLIDAETRAPIAEAQLKVRDVRGRELELNTGDGGSFRLENVPVGQLHISVEAAGYLPLVEQLEVKQRDEVRTQLTLNKRPKKPNVTITAKEVKIAKQVHFQNDSAAILPDSEAILQEIAAALVAHPELKRIEIQGHTDNTGTAPHNLRLSQERAESVRKALTDLGVDNGRLTAVGHGQDRPLMPNSSDASRAKNRRVQLMVLSRD